MPVQCLHRDDDGHQEPQGEFGVAAAYAVARASPQTVASRSCCVTHASVGWPVLNPTRRNPWVGLVDGNLSQFDDLLACADHYGVKITVTIDIIHVLEYLWKAAWAVHAEGSRAAEQWVTERFFEVLRVRHPSRTAKGF